MRGGDYISTIAHFDLPVDDPQRAQKFYSELLDWKFNQVPVGPPYFLIETQDLEGKPGVGGGMGKRQAPDQKIVNYFGVVSIEESLAKVIKLGGKVIMPKNPVPGWGYLAICQDTESNIFSLWQEDKQAK